MQELEVGSSLGAYVIEGFIARGGMGQVYAARHAVYGNPVAVKVLHSALYEDPAWRRRISAEGQAGIALKHPHVLSARELILEGERVGLVMDLVPDAQTLLKVIHREYPQGLALAAALQLFLKVVQGVEYAHTKGVIHGDIKPENVLVMGDLRQPSTWTPLLTDFGTVGLLAEPVMHKGRPAIVASPRYASPEHLLGLDQVDIRSDIFSLGLLLHFLLVGKHASAATTVREAAAALEHPLPLSDLLDLPEVVRELVARAVALDPFARFPTTLDLALAVRDALDRLGLKLDLEDVQGELATELMEREEDTALEQVSAHDTDFPTQPEAAPSTSENSDDTELTAPEEAPQPVAVPPVTASEAVTPVIPLAASEAVTPVTEPVPLLAWVVGVVAVALLLTSTYYALL